MLNKKLMFSDPLPNSEKILQILFVNMSHNLVEIFVKYTRSMTDIYRTLQFKYLPCSWVKLRLKGLPVSLSNLRTSQS